MPSDQKTRIPSVPIRTPMFDEQGNLTRTWIVFFERLGLVGSGTPGGPDLYHARLLVKDATVGDDIADHITADGSGSVQEAVGVLRKAIAADLSVRVNLNGEPLVTVTIPADTPVDKPVVIGPEEFAIAAISKRDVFSWDIVASDGQKDGAGVASFWVGWL